MNNKTCLLTWLAGTLCFALVSMAPLRRVQAESPTQMHLSFRDLKTDQEIRFTLYSKNPWSAFNVTVIAQPKPKVTIELRHSSNVRLRGAEKLWGHPAGELVTRTLTPADLQVLEDFLATYRAKGAVPSPGNPKNPTMAFERYTYSTLPNGHLHADPDLREFFPLSEETQQKFIHDFIGFKPVDSK